ncbi:MAG: acyltransferase [Acidiferrobacteraceae bacterium]
MSYVHKIRNRDGVVADRIYRAYKAVQRVNIKPLPGIYHVLRAERILRRRVGSWLKRKLYDEPLFRMSCQSCGSHLCLIDGIPPLYHLDLHVGNHVTLHGTSTLAGAKVFERPRLVIGDRSHCGAHFTVSVGADVIIGNDVLIANRVSIYAYDHHPLDAVERRQGKPAPAGSSRSVHIGDQAWICAGVLIMKGVTIGEGGVVAAGSVVTSDVAPYTLVAGNPARPVRQLMHLPEVSANAGETLADCRRG